jgi:hypothetical protein
VLLDRLNLRASLWTVLYSLLVVIVCGAMIDADISHFIVVPIGLFALPLLTSVPFLIWLRMPKSDEED